MATEMSALSAYRPRVVAKQTVGLDELAERLARGSLFGASIARMVLEDLCEATHTALRRGEAVTLPGLGRISFDVKLDGRMRPVVRVDGSLRRVVRRADDYAGTITNRESIGRSRDELIARWNAEHPEDPVRAS